MALGRDVLEGKKRGEFDIFCMGDTSLSNPKFLGLTALVRQRSVLYYVMAFALVLIFLCCVNLQNFSTKSLNPKML